jgi:hypothetical protein
MVCIDFGLPYMNSVPKSSITSMTYSTYLFSVV